MSGWQGRWAAAGPPAVHNLSVVTATGALAGLRWVAPSVHCAAVPPPRARRACLADGAPDQPATAALTGGATALTAVFDCTADELAQVTHYSYELVRTDPDPDVTVLAPADSPQVAASSLTPSAGKCSFSVPQTALPSNPDHTRGIFTLKLVRGGRSLGQH